MTSTTRTTPRVWGRVIAALAVSVGVGVALTPHHVDAQDASQWEGSRFDATYSLTSSPTLDAITGVFKHSHKSVAWLEPGEYIGGGPSGEGCGPPDARAQFTSGFNRQRTFKIEGTGPEATLTFPCNGTYKVSITATACDPSSLGPRCDGLNPDHTPYTLTSEIKVAVPPQPATNVKVSQQEPESDSSTPTTSTPPTSTPDVTVPQEDASAQSAGQESDSSVETADIYVSWTFPKNPEPDAYYRVERADPGIDEYKHLSDDKGPGDDASHVDTVNANGTYKYRVMALRPDAGKGVVVTSSKSVAVKVTGLPVDAPPPDDEDEDDADEDVTTPPATSSSSITIPSLDSSGRLPRSSSSKVTIPNLSPPTTEDTGYNDTLDYGDLEEPGELAAEGQSIINSDVDGLDLMPSIAGAMVLVGWAAHVLYLTRLARQF